MKCVLIRPAYRMAGYDEGTQECLGIGYVGAVLRQQGHEVTVVDAELEKLPDAETVARTASVDPQLIGLSIMSEAAVDSAAALVDELRRGCAGAHITCGGNLVSFATEWMAQVLPGLDSLIRFEGEQPLAELADRLEQGRDWSDIAGLCVVEPGGLHMNAPALPPDNLDALPFPLRDTMPIALENGLMPPMTTSRGCQAKCSFCAVHRFNLDPDRPWRFRSPGNVVDEIEQLAVDYGIREVNFVDDDFIGNRHQGQPRAREIAAELRRRRLDIGFSLQCRAQWIDLETFRPLKEAGLQMVFFGIENIDPRTQKVFKKGQSRQVILRTLRVLDELDVYTHVGYIMFNPWTELEEIRDAVHFLHDIGHLNIHTVTNFLQLSPGTPILEPLLADGTAYREPHGGYQYRFADPRTAAVKAIFDRVMWPLFPQWYESLMAKWSILSKQLQTASGVDDVSHQLLERMDELVYEVAIRSVEAIAEDPEIDLLHLASELQQHCRERLADLPELPPNPYQNHPLLCPD